MLCEMKKDVGMRLVNAVRLTTNINAAAMERRGPAIGNRPIADITAHELLKALQRLERKGHHESAIRARSSVRRIFRYEVATLRAQRSPADILRGALINPKVKHHAAILEPAQFGELLRAIDGYGGKIETKLVTCHPNKPNLAREVPEIAKPAADRFKM